MAIPYEIRPSLLYNLLSLNVAASFSPSKIGTRACPHQCQNTEWCLQYLSHANTLGIIQYEYQSRHVCPLVCLKSYQWSRSSGCSGRGQEEDQIYMLGTNLHLHSNCHWDLRGFWPTDTTVFKGPWQSAQTGYRWQKLANSQTASSVLTFCWQRKRHVANPLPP